MAAPQYATIAQIKLHIDTRVLQMLASDTGANADLTSYTTAPNLEAAVERASSDVESYARRGERYTEADLQALQTAEDVTLIGLVADLALYNLAIRRGGDISTAIQQRGDRAHQALKDLASGVRIFAKDSGAEGSGTATAEIVPIGDREQMNLPSDSEFFPPAPDRLY